MARSAISAVLQRNARRVWMVAIAAVFAGLAAAWVAGWRLENVQSASMAPLIPRGSLAVVAPVSPREVIAGDVISFFDPALRDSRILHRVAAVLDRGAEGLFFRTQGDANATPDALLVPAALVEGGLRWHVPRLGSVAWMFRPPAGLAVLVVLSAVVSLRGGDTNDRRNDRQEVQLDARPEAPVPAHLAARISSEALRHACATSWRRYFVRDPRLEAAARERAILAASWRNCYCDATASHRQLDVRDRIIDLNSVDDATSKEPGLSTERR